MNFLEYHYDFLPTQIAILSDLDGKDFELMEGNERNLRSKGIDEYCQEHWKKKRKKPCMF